MYDELLTPPPRPLPRTCFRQLRQVILPLLLLGGGLVMAAIFTQVAFYVQHRDARALARTGAAADGVLVDKLSGRFVMRLTVAYPARDHHLHSIRQWVRTGPTTRWVLIGDPVRVRYDSADPDHAAIEALALPAGSLGGSLPVGLSTVLALFAGALLLMAAARLWRSARLLLCHGTLIPAQLIRPPSWKNFWIAKYAITQNEKIRVHRSFLPPGWRPAAHPAAKQTQTLAAIADPSREASALLLIEPSPEEW